MPNAQGGAETACPTSGCAQCRFVRATGFAGGGQGLAYGICFRGMEKGCYLVSRLASGIWACDFLMDGFKIILWWPQFGTPKERWSCKRTVFLETGAFIMLGPPKTPGHIFVYQMGV